MLTKEVQIRFTDIDMAGHVGNTVIQQYYDMGKMGYFVDILGMPYVWKKEGLIVVSTSTIYFDEIKAEERIAITTKISKLGTKSMTFLQEIINPATQEVKGRSESIMVAFNLEERRSFEIHSDWRDRILQHEDDL
ncbi:MAG: acyl-CoA thioesterase [Rikenellaceae bacterium]